MKILVDAFGFLPLFDQDNTYLMSQPLPKLINEPFHSPYAKIIYPSLHYLVDSFEGRRISLCNAFLSDKFFATVLIQSFLALIIGLAFPFGRTFPIRKSLES